MTANTNDLQDDLRRRRCAVDGCRRMPIAALGGLPTCSRHIDRIGAEFDNLAREAQRPTAITRRPRR